MEDMFMVAVAPFYVMAVAVTGKVVYDLYTSADKMSISDMVSSLAAGLKK
jgi:hypothetical protein